MGRGFSLEIGGSAVSPLARWSCVIQVAREWNAPAAAGQTPPPHAAAFGGASGGVLVSEFRRRFTLKSPAVHELSNFYHWWGNFLKKVVIQLSNMFKV